MVQNQVTVLGCNHRNGPSAKLGHWRKDKQARTSSMISQYHPPPTKTVGGGGRISREICRFFAFRAIIWRRGQYCSARLMLAGCIWAGEVAPLLQDAQLLAYVS